jgi:hypothetical protein
VSSYIQTINIQSWHSAPIRHGALLSWYTQRWYYSVVTCVKAITQLGRFTCTKKFMPMSVFWVVTPCGQLETPFLCIILPTCSGLKIKAASSFQTLASTYKSIRCHNPEYQHRHLHRRETHKCHNKFIICDVLEVRPHIQKQSIVRCLGSYAGEGVDDSFLEYSALYSCVSRQTFEKLDDVGSISETSVNF